MHTTYFPHNGDLDYTIETLESRIAGFDEALEMLAPGDPLADHWNRQRGTLVNRQAVIFAIKAGL